jgi:hypothetical protein
LPSLFLLDQVQNVWIARGVDQGKMRHTVFRELLFFR